MSRFVRTTGGLLQLADKTLGPADFASIVRKLEATVCDPARQKVLGLDFARAHAKLKTRPASAPALPGPLWDLQNDPRAITHRAHRR